MIPKVSSPPRRTKKKDGGFGAVSQVLEANTSVLARKNSNSCWSRAVVVTDKGFAQIEVAFLDNSGNRCMHTMPIARANVRQQKLNGAIQPLPAGWEQRSAPDGRVYYVDHNTKMTTFVRPPPPPSHKKAPADQIKSASVLPPSVDTSPIQHQGSVGSDPAVPLNLTPNRAGQFIRETIPVQPPQQAMRLDAGTVKPINRELPPGWEAMVDKKSTVYFVDHNTRTTTYERPVCTIQLKPSQPAPPLELPKRWEERIDAKGIAYYVDHETRTTTYERPVCSAQPLTGQRPTQLPPVVEHRPDRGSVQFNTQPGHLAQHQVQMQQHCPPRPPVGLCPPQQPMPQQQSQAVPLGSTYPAPMMMTTFLRPPCPAPGQGLVHGFAQHTTITGWNANRPPQHIRPAHPVNRPPQHIRPAYPMSGHPHQVGGPPRPQWVPGIQQMRPPYGFGNSYR